MNSATSLPVLKLDFDMIIWFDLMQSLSGHTSGIDSVSFDSSEVLVAAGAASGTVKLWDLEEAKSMPSFLFILNKRFILCI